MGRYSTEGRVLCLMGTSYVYNSFRGTVTAQWMATQVRQKCWTFCIDNIIGRTCKNRWINIYQIAIADNNLELQGMQPSECFALCQCRGSHWKIF